MIHLKTKPANGKTQRFAILIEPDDFIPTPKAPPQDNDQELFQIIRNHGEAIIWEFEEQNPFNLKERHTILTPEKFEAEWIGD